MLQWYAARRSARYAPLPVSGPAHPSLARSDNGALVVMQREAKQQVPLKHSAGCSDLVALKSDGSKPQQQQLQPSPPRSAAQSPPPYSPPPLSAAASGIHSCVSAAPATSASRPSGSSERSESEMVEFAAVAGLCDSDNEAAMVAATAAAAFYVSPLTVGEQWQLEYAELSSINGGPHAMEARYRPRRASRIFTFDSLPKKRSRRQHKTDTQPIDITVK